MMIFPDRETYLRALSRLDGVAMRLYNQADEQERRIVEEAIRQPIPRVEAKRARHQPAPMKGERLLCYESRQS